MHNRCLTYARYDTNALHVDNVFSKGFAYIQYVMKDLHIHKTSPNHKCLAYRQCQRNIFITIVRFHSQINHFLKKMKCIIPSIHIIYKSVPTFNSLNNLWIQTCMMKMLFDKKSSTALVITQNVSSKQLVTIPKAIRCIYHFPTCFEIAGQQTEIIDNYQIYREHEISRDPTSK